MKLSIDTSTVRHCAKCSRVEPPLFRHHKGCDSLVGQYNRGIAANYDKYLDCVLLCKECHCEIHYLNNTKVFSHWINRTPRGARQIRKSLIKFTDRWLAGKVKSPNKDSKAYKEFHTEFMDSLTLWLELQDVGP